MTTTQTLTVHVFFVAWASTSMVSSYIRIWSCGNNSPRETDTCHKVKKNFGDLRFSRNLRFFGRADFWISQSRAKFDDEADFEVRKSVAPQKPRQIGEKRNFPSKMFVGQKKSALKNKTSRIVRNAFWQSFVPIRAMFEELRKKFHLTPNID